MPKLVVLPAQRDGAEIGLGLYAGEKIAPVTIVAKHPVDEVRDVLSHVENGFPHDSLIYKVGRGKGRHPSYVAYKDLNWKVPHEPPLWYRMNDPQVFREGGAVGGANVKAPVIEQFDGQKHIVFRTGANYVPEGRELTFKYLHAPPVSELDARASVVEEQIESMANRGLFFPERIVDVKGPSLNQKVLIKWKDYGEEENTWESWDGNEGLQSALKARGVSIPKSLQ